jgi:hypothetical protein
MRKPVVTLYTRAGCHLCEEAKASIEAANCSGYFTLEVINIDLDPALLGRYLYEIPVVLIDGIKAFKYRVDPGEFRRRLRRRHE